MSLWPLVEGGVPVAAPVASSHDRHAPLWDSAFAQITPGALPFPCEVLLSLSGGRA
jgi:hypothetical protein